MSRDEVQKESKKSKPKKVRMRAFRVENYDLSKSSSPAKSLILSRLDSTESVKERCMILSPEDSKKEQDLISFHQVSEKSKSIFCTMIRISPSNEVEQIPNELFNKKSFTMDELKDSGIESSVVCKSHFYFCISDNYLVTNLPLNKTISSLQTYVCWLTNNELIEFTPMIDKKNQTQLKDLDFIKVKDPGKSKEVEETEEKQKEHDTAQPPVVSEEKSKTFKIPDMIMNIIKSALSDTTTYSDLINNKIVSAELLIKFNKPRKMTNEEYAKILGATLKPVSDLDNITFKRKDGKSEVKGKELLKTKTVDIEITETGKLVEQMVFQEMSKYLIEIKSEEETH
ncbi:hypothetical protein SOASR030_01820 [Leminorella grimontii]|uniref:Uncharacterized protein n=1 Tax=Leminorella grimontii TaxID=82981 RepID=A0AAV5MWM6_9GAMM|nr:hypothetical protein [Leminorella grimontii]KFC95746.1 hypothetical protein GLGR_1909 [Leminorella grimontii ATCC 33999 = DSM 5078]GKX54070.1 hypothetical protein SOASR030_01820 [Leminorella grimontii]VFS60150.1 Uncharacterised protein [Leminorella grimontii]